MVLSNFPIWNPSTGAISNSNVSNRFLNCEVDDGRSKTFGEGIWKSNHTFVSDVLESLSVKKSDHVPQSKRLTDNLHDEETEIINCVQGKKGKEKKFLSWNILISFILPVLKANGRLRLLKVKKERESLRIEWIPSSCSLPNSTVLLLTPSLLWQSQDALPELHQANQVCERLSWADGW